MRGGGVGTRVACASKNTTASCGARSGGPAGRRTWVGRRRTRFCAYALVVKSGVRLQVDCPDLAMGRHTKWAALSDEAFVRDVVRPNVAALNAALREAGASPSTTRVHLCWGNYAGPQPPPRRPRGARRGPARVLLRIGAGVVRAGPARGAGVDVPRTRPRRARFVATAARLPPAGARELPSFPVTKNPIQTRRPEGILWGQKAEGKRGCSATRNAAVRGRVKNVEEGTYSAAA